MNKIQNGRYEMLSRFRKHPFFKALELGFRIIHIAGINATQRHPSISIEHKGEIDLVTNIDIETEKYLISEILQSFPDHSIISEESETIRTSSAFSWIIDPIDGTTNFAHQLPLWTISIAFYQNKKPIAGWVYAPEMNQFFFGLHSYGSWLNNAPIHTSSQSVLIKSLLATGFPYDIRQTKHTNMDLFTHFSKTTQAVRRFGSASLDICLVGCGMLEGYWEQMLRLWDFAAARIIVEEAGGMITNIYNQPLPFHDSSVLCANPELHSTMYQEIRSSDACIQEIQ